MPETEVARRIAALSVDEIVAASCPCGTPRFVRRAIAFAARIPSQRLGRVLARFDARVPLVGVSAAARETLETLGVELNVETRAAGSLPPRTGGLLVVTNHPGAYDALAMLAALGRDDVALIAAERDFLRALPAFAKHLVFVADPEKSEQTSLPARATGLRKALAWLEAGNALIQFGAGAIEPDARFLERGAALLGPWPDGSSMLAHRTRLSRERGPVAIVPAFVSGVHSPRVKHLSLVAWAERRKFTTLAPLIQTTIPGFRDVRVRVAFGAPLENARETLTALTSRTARTAFLQEAVAALA